MNLVEVVKPGLLTTLQDSGRAGFAHIGIGRTGAFDAPAFRLANALAGNPPDACALEITLLGPTLRFHAATRIAITGAPMAVRANDADVPMWAAITVPAGSTITTGRVRSGCRSYLAVGGGFDVPATLGSRSSDVNARLGPLDGRALKAGDRLPVRSLRVPPAAAFRTAANWRLDPRPWLPGNPQQPLRLLRGRHLERLTRQSSNALFSASFTVHADSNRVGLKLTGPRLQLRAKVELTSEGCVPGLLQLPPSGRLIVFGPEGPVSGGYPRLGQVAAVDIPRLAQLRPGDAVRFTPCAFEAAIAAFRKRERQLQKLEAAIHGRLQGKQNHGQACSSERPGQRIDAS